MGEGQNQKKIGAVQKPLLQSRQEMMKSNHERMETKFKKYLGSKIGKTWSSTGCGGVGEGGELQVAQNEKTTEETGEGTGGEEGTSFVS